MDVFFKMCVLFYRGPQLFNIHGFKHSKTFGPVSHGRATH